MSWMLGKLGTSLSGHLARRQQSPRSGWKCKTKFDTAANLSDDDETVRPVIGCLHCSLRSGGGAKAVVGFGKV